MEKGVNRMTFEQTMLTMINDKMLNNGQISQDMHSSIQKDILSMVSTSASMKSNSQLNSSFSEYQERIS